MRRWHCPSGKTPGGKRPAIGHGQARKGLAKMPKYPPRRAQIRARELRFPAPNCPPGDFDERKAQVVMPPAPPLLEKVRLFRIEQQRSHWSAIAVANPGKVSLRKRARSGPGAAR
jgi:hypothetical protein